MDFILISLHVFIIGLLSYWIWKKEKLPFFWFALAIKLLAGLGLGLLYKFYYSTGDTWSLFDDGVKVVEAITQNHKTFLSFFWKDDISTVADTLDNNRPRALFLVKWIAAFNFINGNNYWITSLYFSFISFLSCWTFYRTLAKHFANINLEAAIAFLFIPSIVFWGSGIIKESLALAALFAITNIFLQGYWAKNFQWHRVVLGLLFFWVLWNLKYYWAAVWLAVVLPLVLIEFLKTKIHFVKRFPKSSWALVLIMAAGLVSILHPNFYYHRFLSVIVENHNAYLSVSDPSDAIHFHNLEPSIVSVAINSPWAVVSGIFRPFILEGKNFLQVLASLENLILLVLFLISLFNIRKYLFHFTELHLAVAAYIIVMCIFLTLSTPNFGSLSRFKIGFTPMLWLVVLSTSGILKGKLLNLRK